MKNGLNKVLYDKRKELKLKSTKAALKIKVLRLELHLIERGYIPIRKRLKPRFIKAYNLPEDFFEDNYRYPEEVFDDKKESKFTAWLLKLFDSFKFRIACWFLTAGFLGMAIGGLCLNYNAMKSTSSYFSEDVLTLRNTARSDQTNLVVEDIHDCTFVQILLDPYYSYSSHKEGASTTMDVSVNFFTLDKNLPQTFFKGVLGKDVEEVHYTIRFETRTYLDGSFRTKMKVLKSSFGVDEKVFYATANDYKDGSRKFFEVVAMNEEGQLVEVPKTDPSYSFYTNEYDDYFVQFTQDLYTFFDEKCSITFDSFKSQLNSASSRVTGDRITSGLLIIFGAALSILFFACSFVHLFTKAKVIEDFEENIEEVSFVDRSSSKSSKKRKKKVFKKNWLFFPLLPETLIRVASIALLMAGSIGIYYIFLSLTNLELGKSLGLTVMNTIINSLTIVGIICIFFMKLDIYQNKKSVFLINYSLFFLGLGYYILLILVNGHLSGGEGALAKGGVMIMDYVPGNSIWGILAFNILIMFLFYEPKSYEGNKKKMYSYRLMSLIPLAYLLVSGVLSIGKSNFGWKIPFEIYSLFFSKSAVLVIFAVAFVFAIYFYKRWIFKRYPKEQAELYVKGNKYFFMKNLIASGIILVLGLVALILMFTNPSNSFAQNVWILCAIPFILLYHPHLGKRIGWFDDIMTVLYGISLYSGIIILAISSLSFIYTI